jgi:gamma-glutamylcyclotransferase (GGCT)/AIG2-like uncharacterized protein YtfP
MRVRLFVYGTLKPDELNRPDANEYQRSCRSHLIKSERAIAYGYLYHLPAGYPAMIPGRAVVQGSLLTFANPSILELLDEYEGYDPNSLENDYDRRRIEVFDPEKISLGHAWAYFMQPQQVDRASGIPISNGIWNSQDF